MDKSEFLKRLNAGLKDLPVDEKQEITADYEEHFAAGAEAGRTEAEISAALGDPDTIGKQLLSASLIETAEKTGSLSALCRAALAIVGLGLFNFIIALAPILVIASLILVVLVCGLSFVFSGVVVLVVTLLPPILPADMMVATPFETPFAQISVSIGLIASGLLISIVGIYPARFFVRAMARYFRMNLSVVRRAYGNEH